MSKLDAKCFKSITPFAKQWIFGDNMYEFLNQYQDFLSNDYGIIDLGTLNYGKDSTWEGMFGTGDLVKLIQHVRGSTVFSSRYINAGISSFANMPDMSMQVFDSGSVYFKNINAWNSMTQEQFKAAMQGVYLVYKLADNIGRVNMESLNWQLQSYTIEGVERIRFSSSLVPDMSAESPLLDIYTPKYTASRVPTTDLGTDKTICGYEDKLYVIDWDYATAEAFKASLANTYLYFKKQS